MNQVQRINCQIDLWTLILLIQFIATPKDTHVPIILTISMDLLSALKPIPMGSNNETKYKVKKNILYMYFLFFIFEITLKFQIWL